MTCHVVLLRGVNVSGKNRLPMAEFRELLASLGFDGVKTYIQSGNAVIQSSLEADAVEGLVADGIEGQFGFRPEVFVMGADALQKAVEGNPFDAAMNKVHAFFLKTQQPSLNEKLRPFATQGEEWHMLPSCLILYTPNGLGTSKLAEKLPRLLQGQTTARNMNTVHALIDLVKGS